MLVIIAFLLYLQIGIGAGISGNVGGSTHHFVDLPGRPCSQQAGIGIVEADGGHRRSVKLIVGGFEPNGGICVLGPGDGQIGIISFFALGIALELRGQGGYDLVKLRFCDIAALAEQHAAILGQRAFIAPTAQAQRGNKLRQGNGCTGPLFHGCIERIQIGCKRIHKAWVGDGECDGQNTVGIIDYRPVNDRFGFISKAVLRIICVPAAKALLDGAVVFLRAYIRTLNDDRIHGRELRKLHDLRVVFGAGGQRNGNAKYFFDILLNI